MEEQLSQDEDEPLPISRKKKQVNYKKLYQFNINVINGVGFNFNAKIKDTIIGATSIYKINRLI